MTGEKGVGWGGVGADVTDWQSVGRPTLDPSSCLRVSGPSLGMRGNPLSHRLERGVGRHPATVLVTPPGMDSCLGAGMTE